DRPRTGPPAPLPGPARRDGGRGERRPGRLRRGPGPPGPEEPEGQGAIYLGAGRAALPQRLQEADPRGPVAGPVRRHAPELGPGRGACRAGDAAPEPTPRRREGGPEPGRPAAPLEPRRLRGRVQASVPA